MGAWGSWAMTLFDQLPKSANGDEAEYTGSGQPQSPHTLTGSDSTHEMPDSEPIPPPALLLVDDEPSILTALKRALRRLKIPTHTALCPSEALPLLEAHRIAVVISDYKMPEMDGITFLSEVRERWPNVQRIMLTGQADEAAIEGVVNRSAVFRFLSKPWDQIELVGTVKESFERFQTLTENDRLWALTTRKNDELVELARGLEAKVERRTQQLVRAKQEWERTFDAIVDPVAIVDASYSVVRANVAYAEHAALPIRAVPGQRCHQLVAGRDAPCEGCPLQETLAGEPPRGVDVDATTDRVLNVWAFPFRESTTPSEPVDSGERPSMVPWSPAVPSIAPPARSLPTAVCYYRDVTEERALSEKLARTEKLAALGLFVGGVAHEINNPLGGILAFAQLLLRNPPEPDELEEALKSIENSALRCKRIIDSLQSFSRSTHVVDAAINLELLVRDTVEAFERDYATRNHLRIAYGVDPETPLVRGDPALIHQLFRNLLQNAHHAVVGERGNVEIDVRPVAGPDGPGARIEIVDDGCGMEEAKLKRIFDPFFTTKADQKRGTGLGLSISHRIVEQHRGQMEVESKVGEGTTFRIYLPTLSRSSSEPKRQEDV